MLSTIFSAPWSKWLSWNSRIRTRIGRWDATSGQHGGGAACSTMDIPRASKPTETFRCYQRFLSRLVELFATRQHTRRVIVHIIIIIIIVIYFRSKYYFPPPHSHFYGSNFVLLLCVNVVRRPFARPSPVRIIV